MMYLAMEETSCNGLIWNICHGENLQTFPQASGWGFLLTTLFTKQIRNLLVVDRVIPINAKQLGNVFFFAAKKWGYFTLYLEVFFGLPLFIWSSSKCFCLFDFGDFFQFCRSCVEGSFFVSRVLYMLYSNSCSKNWARAWQIGS